MEENKNSNVESEENGSSRRSFLKKGAVVSVPLVVSAFSRPVLATSCGFSGFLSGNLSGQHDDKDCGVGYSHGGWKNNGAPWGDTDYTQGVEDTNHKLVSQTGLLSNLKGDGTGSTFKLAFDSDIFSYGDKHATLLDVLMWEPLEGDYHQFVAALLNANCSSIDFLLSEQDVLNLFKEHLYGIAYGSFPTLDKYPDYSSIPALLESVCIL